MISLINLHIWALFSRLGVLFSEAHAALAGQALKSIFALNKYIQKIVNLKPRHVLDLFDKLIKPILNYSSEVLGVKQCTQNDFIFGKLGRTSLIVERHLRIIKYWLNVCMSQENKYIKLVYNLLKSDIQTYPNRENLASLVRDLLSNLGMRYSWIEQGVGNVNAFISLVRQRLTDNFIQNWNARINESTRASCYKNISSFSFKTYLDTVTEKKFRIALPRLRTSSHRLEVEAGRWVRPVRKSLNERLCTFCGVLQDEFHFILECPAYMEERSRFIKKCFCKRPNMIKFIELITSENKVITQNLACYVEKAFKTRNSLLYSF